MEEKTVYYPVITINGVEIKAGSPKARVWREMNEFSFSAADDVVDGMVDLIVKTFNKPEITADTVYENVELGDIVKLYKTCCNYVLGIFTEAMENISKNA